MPGPTQHPHGPWPLRGHQQIYISSSKGPKHLRSHTHPGGSGSRGQGSPRPPGQHQAGWSGAPTAHILSSRPETQRGCPQAGSGHAEAVSTAGRQPIEDPTPPTTGSLSGPSTQKSPRRGRGYEAHRTPRLPAPLPGSLLMLGASVGGRCPSSPSLTRGPELPPWRWASISARSTVPGPQAARTGRRGRNGPSLPC